MKKVFGRVLSGAAVELKGKQLLVSSSSTVTCWRSRRTRRSRPPATRTRRCGVRRRASSRSGTTSIRSRAFASAPRRRRRPSPSSTAASTRRRPPTSALSDRRERQHGRRPTRSLDRRLRGPRHDGGRYPRQLPSAGDPAWRRTRRSSTIRTRTPTASPRRATSSLPPTGSWRTRTVQHPRRQLLAARVDNASIRFDPLDKAVEGLWLERDRRGRRRGQPRATAAGDIELRARQRPVRDHGRRTDQHGTPTRATTRAAWSAYGNTMDGFLKPDLSAPGRYMLAPVPVNATIAREFRIASSLRG